MVKLYPEIVIKFSVEKKEANSLTIIKKEDFSFNNKFKTYKNFDLG